jgi:hypothetical protein
VFRVRFILHVVHLRSREYSLGPLSGKPTPFQTIESKIN